MRFVIYPDDNIVQVRTALDGFIKLAKQEFDKSKSIKGVSWALKKAGMPKVMLNLYFEDEKDRIIFYAKTSVFSKGRGRMVKKMKKNLKGYFRAKGVRIKKIEGFNE